MVTARDITDAPRRAKFRPDEYKERLEGRKQYIACVQRLTPCNEAKRFNRDAMTGLDRPFRCLPIPSDSAL
jgi:hypothetical protein